ncbi:hypothetical protein Cp4431_02120 [Clostridium perfringens]|jgi:hypothetical protein|nr:hypothetical protein [Clostridium perfringens]
MEFGGWSSWQVLVLTICIATAIICGVIVGTKNKNHII